ncbi:MAG TPA: hypothetical protein VGG20_28710 [Thermoanaerobaculia bacterium]|jgi:hypothetical protein
MNDFLGRLAARAQGEAAVVKPRVRSRYEAGEAGPPPAPEGWGEEVTETAVSPASPASPEPAVKAVKAVAPREARLPGEETIVERTVETAARPVPAPPPPEARPRPVQAARKAARESVVAPPEAPARAALTPPAVPAPAPRRSELPAAPPEPGPRLERRVEEPGAVPAPPETRPAVRMRQPADLRTAPLPTVGPRRAIPDLGPAPAGRAETAGDTEEVVRVSIGRIDVHAGPPPVQAPAPRRPAGPRLSLSDYLTGRDERRRR